MKNICRFLCIFCIVFYMFNLGYLDVEASSLSKTESLVDYAMKWNNNANIPYIWGGGRGSTDTLESLSLDSYSGTDCSGFVALVYKHFGISLTAQSESMYAEAKKVFYSQEEAVPGDVCWWEGHVALYIGNGRILHTNTSKPPTNFPHISELGTNYRVPSAYLRMVDDVSTLGKVSNDTEETVETVTPVGSIVTESDLTGMPTQFSLEYEQEQIELKSRGDLGEKDQDRLVFVGEAINTQSKSWVMYLHRVMSFVGLVILVYGVVLLVSLLFDCTNSFLDLELLSVLTLGRWVLVCKSDVEDGLVKVGYSRDSHKTYVTVGMVIIRAVIVLIIGCMLISNSLLNCVFSILEFILIRVKS